MTLFVISLLVLVANIMVYKEGMVLLPFTGAFALIVGIRLLYLNRSAKKQTQKESKFATSASELGRKFPKPAGADAKHHLKLVAVNNQLQQKQQHSQEPDISPVADADTPMPSTPEGRRKAFKVFKSNESKGGRTLH